jgi:hypothetical protein
MMRWFGSIEVDFDGIRERRQEPVSDEAVREEAVG